MENLLPYGMSSVKLPLDSLVNYRFTLPIVLKVHFRVPSGISQLYGV